MASGNSFVQSDKTTELPPKTVERKNPPPVPIEPQHRKPSGRLTDDQRPVGRLTNDRLQLNITNATNQKVTKAVGGRAIPLCLPNDCELDKQTNHFKKKDVTRNSLVINEDAIAVLQSITDPVCVIAIVGPCRTGKSYILSRLISSDRDTPPCFKLGHKIDPETMGIWMWDTPIQYQLKDGRNISIILLDTEGIDAYNSLERGDTQVFTLSVLLSSLLIYNSQGVPRREDLNKMMFIANLAKSIRSSSQKKLSHRDIKQIAPSFFWLLRDVLLEPTDRNHQPCHFRDYILEKVLGESDDDDWENDTDSIQYKATKYLLNFFKNFDAETIPPPSTSPDVMKNIEDPIYKDEISPDFIQQVEYVRARILEKCEPKRGYAPGSLVNGIQLAGMLQIYVDALNSPAGIPEVSSAWDQALKNTYQIATTKAIEPYKNEMSSFSFPMEEGDLKRHHSQATEKAIECFRQLTRLDTEDSFKEHLPQFMATLSTYSDDGECTGGLLLRYLEQNKIASEKKCQSLASSLKREHLTPIFANLSPETKIEDIANAIKTVEQQYYKTAVGPAKEKVYQSFIEELEAERNQHKATLETIKGYDANMKFQDEAIKQQRLLYEEGQREKANLQLHIDNQTVEMNALEKQMTDTKNQMRDELNKKTQEQENLTAALLQSNHAVTRLVDETKNLRTEFDKQLARYRMENETALKKMRSMETEQKNLESQVATMKTKLERKSDPGPGPCAIS